MSMADEVKQLIIEVSQHLAMARGAHEAASKFRGNEAGIAFAREQVRAHVQRSLERVQALANALDANEMSDAQLTFSQNGQQG
jgi:hypothetical protein